MILNRLDWSECMLYSGRKNAEMLLGALIGKTISFNIPQSVAYTPRYSGEMPEKCPRGGKGEKA